MGLDISQIDSKLIDKYSIYAYDYIEYPHKSYWNKSATEEKYKKGLKELMNRDNPLPSVLYVHIPFCQQMCYFCVCHFTVTQDYQRVLQYQKHLFKEIDLLTEFIRKENLRPNFKEVHLGGGSPTYLKEPEFEALVEKLKPLVNFDNLNEFVIEIDPRRVDEKRLLYYHSKGISRLSFGIQDFNHEVQVAINRVQPATLVEKLLTKEVRESFDSINFDLLVGLPFQTVETIRQTMDKVVEIGPSRIALAFMHYSPKWNPHQDIMKKSAPLPSHQGRKILFQEAVNRLISNGYIRTGFEHFAKPTDAVAKAVKEKKAFYNSLGATTGNCTELLGLGLHSYSRIGEKLYAQHVYEFKEYEDLVNAGKFPLFREYELSEEDQIRRDLINKLRTYFQLELSGFETAHQIKFQNYFSKEMSLLKEFEKDGLVELTGDKITITEIGKYFSNVICRVFDTFARIDTPQFFEGTKLHF